MDFTYQKTKTPEGVKLEIVTEGSRFKGKVWREIALQIYCENGKDGFREIGHFQNGAPFLFHSDDKISISHTEGCLVVASRPLPADANAGVFTPETALGVDVEKIDREKVLRIRERFLSVEEQNVVSAESVEANVLAWTCKEAMLKGVMEPSIDWHNDIIITRLPAVKDLGEGCVRYNGVIIDFKLATLRVDDFIITMAYI